MVKEALRLFHVILCLLLLFGCASNEFMGASGKIDSTPAIAAAIPATDQITPQEGNGTKKDNEPILNKSIEQVSGDVKVHFIDVGQGASQLLIGPTGKTMLIDAGNNDQEERMVQYLRQYDIRKIDILIGTHPDADHVGGMDAVINNFEIGNIYMPKVHSNTKTFEEVLRAIQRKGLTINTAKAGVVLDWEDEVYVEMMGPVKAYDNTNEMSAVVRVAFGNISFLLTGDSEKEAEMDMIYSNGNTLQSTILLVGHHGSRNATSNELLEAVQPTYAVIQVGENNYGHPTNEVLERLKAKNITVYRNDIHGDIIFATNGAEISVTLTNNTTIEKEAEGQPIAQEKADTPASVTDTSLVESKPDVVYKSCAEVRAAGKAPLYRGEPGYSSKLDRDNDGIACE